MTILLSCENNLDNEKDIKNHDNLINSIELVSGTLKIENKTVLKNILKSYQNNVEKQNNFNDEIRDLQKKGFKPLTPFFSENDVEGMQIFLQNKSLRLQKVQKDFSLKSRLTTPNEIDFEDEIIADPAFAAILNEDRELFVGDSLYKYTETGLYFCLIKDKEKLYNYLSHLNPASRKNRITNRVTPCNQALKSTNKSLSMSEITQVEDGINLFIPISDCDPYPPYNPEQPIPNPTPTIINTPSLIKQNLEICSIQKQGFFEKIFGESESDYDVYNDGTRVKTSFWNHNYFLFGSIGCSVRFQKRVKILGVSGWQKSYAQKIELGVNGIKYDFSFDVPLYTGNLTPGLPTLPSVIYVYSGKNYNQYGKVISGNIPTQGINFPFTSERNGQNAVEIHLFDNKFYQVDFDLSVDGANTQIYKLLSEGVKSLASSLPYTDPNKIELQKGLDSNDIIFDIAKVVPLSNKITFMSLGQKWTNNDDNAITHYFDYNFLISIPSNTNDIGAWARAFIGAKSYGNVKADIYGATMHNGIWKGRRLLKK